MEKVLIEKKALQVIRKVLAKNDQREALSGINLTADFVEVTNGRMAVRFPRSIISTSVEGNFKIISTALNFNKLFSEIVIEKTELEYPDFSKIFPVITGQDQTHFELLPNKQAPLSLSSALIRLYKHTGNAYNIEYLEALAPLKDTWTVFNIGTDKVALLVSGGTSAVILPFRLLD